MTKCSFCGKEAHYFQGVNLIKNDGNVDFFCSSKCRKNDLNLERDKRKIKWTEAYRIVRDKTALDAANAKIKEAARVEAKKEEKPVSKVVKAKKA